MAVDTAEEFLAVLEKSRLLGPEQLDDARLAAQRDDDPKLLAKALVQQGALTRWQAGQLLAGRSSFFLGKYKLIEPIGRGGMGSVFLGQHTTMNRRVALKILSRQVGKDPASVERFLDEARAVAALDHPNIVQAYSVDHDADRYYLVMEYIEGRDLQQLVELEGLPDFQTAADYIRQAADGLAHGHGRNMIHCDIKPSNLLVNSQGQVKIVDMGLTRLNGRQQEEANGRGERILGSVDYLAPEQALGASDLDHRADIYSLGCTLYFLLTGHPPFPEGTLPERIVKHQLQQPRSIHRERPDAPAGLVKICEQMMAKQAEDRFQSAAEVSSVLAECCLSEPNRKRIVPLKTAQPLEEPPGERPPKIDVDAEPRPAPAAGGSNRAVPQKTGTSQTRRWKIAVWGATGLLAVAVALLIYFASAPAGPDRTQARPDAPGAEKGRLAGRQPTLSGGPAGGLRTPPPDKSPTHKSPPDSPPALRPPDGKPPDQQPPADRPDRDPHQTDRPEPERPEPKEPKKESQQPAKKPDAPQQKDPFRELAAAVDLPVLRAGAAADAQTGAPVSLGKLLLELDAACQIELKGGPRYLALDQDQNRSGWLIRLDSEGNQGADPQPTDLARIWLEEQTLKFQWLQGVGRARGNHLRNCGLLFRVGQQTRWLPLCRPKTVEPLVVDLDGGVARTSLPTAEWMPKISQLRLQVTGLEGPFPEHAFIPPEGISDEGRVEVLLSGDKLPEVALHLSLVNRGRATSVELATVYRLADQVQRPFKSEEAMRLTREFYALRNLAENTLDKLNRQDPRRPDVKRQVELLKESLEQLQALGDLYHQIHHAGKIHFRVFRAVDDQQIELFATGPTKPSDALRHQETEEH